MKHNILYNTISVLELESVQAQIEMGKPDGRMGTWMKKDKDGFISRELNLNTPSSGYRERYDVPDGSREFEIPDFGWTVHAQIHTLSRRFHVELWL